MKNIFSLIVGAVVLLTSANAYAERTVLYFHFEGCPYCPAAKSEISNSPDSKFYKLYTIDITKRLDWKQEFKVTSVPKVVVVDIENNKYRILSQWPSKDGTSISTILKRFRVDKPAK